MFALLGLSVAFRILPISLCSFRIHSFPDTTFWDSLAYLALGPHRPSVSPVLCGLRLTRLTGLTCCNGICCVCGVWFVCVFFLFVVFWFGFAFGFCFVSCSLCLLACLSSFTDWCIAHKQQSREQKKEGRQSGRPTFFGRPTNASGGQQAVRPHRGKVRLCCSFITRFSEATSNCFERFL